MVRVRLARRVSSSPEPSKTKHYVGLPPELTGGIDKRTEMPEAEVLIVMRDEPVDSSTISETSRRILAKLSEGAVKGTAEESKEPGWMLYRCTADGRDAGDTWHESLDDVLDQAALEYGDAFAEWQELEISEAKSVEEVLQYVLRNTRETP